VVAFVVGLPLRSIVMQRLVMPLPLAVSWNVGMLAAFSRPLPRNTMLTGPVMLTLDTAPAVRITVPPASVTVQPERR